MFSHVKAARLLGWTSLAVGATELFAPEWLQKQMGVRGNKRLIRGFGVRQIAAGVMLLGQPGLNKNLAAGLWTRVAGDALDLAALGKARASTRRAEGLLTISSIVATITGIDLIVALLVQHDLHKAKKISIAARSRVRRISQKSPTVTQTAC